MKQKNAAGWVEVAALGQDEQAILVAGLLQAAGIPCAIEGPSTHPIPENLGSFGVSRIMVPSERGGEARRLIAERERGGAESVLSEEDLDE